jgi:hypothetical protein
MYELSEYYKEDLEIFDELTFKVIPLIIDQVTILHQIFLYSQTESKSWCRMKLMMYLLLLKV